MVSLHECYFVSVNQHDVIASFGALAHAVHFAMFQTDYSGPMYIDGPKFGPEDEHASWSIDKHDPLRPAVLVPMSSVDATRRAAKIRAWRDEVVLDWTCKEMARAIVEYDRGQLGGHLLSKGARP